MNLSEHSKVEGLRIDTLCEAIDTLQQDVKEIRENHLAHLKTDLEVLKESVSWLCKTYWIVVTAAVGSLVATVLGLILNN